MKRFFIGSIVALITIFATPATATTPENPETSTQKPPPSMIDGIEVPFDVINYAQMKYQGHAITEVSKIKRGGKDVYKVRVDNDDIPDDYDSIILFYSMKWKLLDKDKLTPTPKPAYTPQRSNSNDGSEAEKDKEPRSENNENDKPQERRSETPTEPDDPPPSDDDSDEDFEDDEDDSSDEDLVNQPTVVTPPRSRHNR